jgi:hypothetical protein
MSPEKEGSLIKQVTVVAILGVLAGLVVFSYMFSRGCVERIACLHNQQVMFEALVSYEEDNAGNNPGRIFGLRRYYRDRAENFARCPARRQDSYSYDPSSGAVACPNPAHRPSLWSLRTGRKPGGPT